MVFASYKYLNPFEYAISCNFFSCNLSSHTFFSPINLLKNSSLSFFLRKISGISSLFFLIISSFFAILLLNSLILKERPLIKGFFILRGLRFFNSFILLTNFSISWSICNEILSRFFSSLSIKFWTWIFWFLILLLSSSIFILIFIFFSIIYIINFKYNS